MKKSKLIIVVTLLICMSMSGIAFAQGEAGVINSAGYGNTYVIKNDGSLWGWGGQYVGNGTGYREGQGTPVKIMDHVRSVSSGGGQLTVAVKKDDTLWGWGYLNGYPTGAAQDATELYPVKLNIDDVKSAAAGHGFILALKNDNTLWVCGDMFIGDGTDTMADGSNGFVKVSNHVIDMHAGVDNVYLIKEDNTLWGYGNNSDAQLGNMTTSGDTNTDAELSLTKILDDVKFVTACPDGNVVFAIRLDNSLYGWGNSGFYAEGHGWIEDAGSPYKVMDQVKTVAVDGESAFIVKMDNTLWGWGYSYEGKSIGSEQVPYQITDQVLSVTLGDRHASVLKTDNTLWTMGGNYRGGLGYNSDETWYTPLTKILDNVQDSPAGWAFEEVDKAIGEQLIPENMQNNYTKSITREEFCILAIRMIEVKSGIGIDEYLDEVGTEIAPLGTFVDCDTKEVRAAKALGITDGTSPTEFSPSNLLTREQAAKFLTTTAMACGKDANLSTPAYADINEIADWAKPYTGYVFNINVMKGVGANRFDPQGSYQRQQAFMTMYRIWKSIDQVNTENVEVSFDTSSTHITEPEKTVIPTNEPYHSDFKVTIEGTSKNDGEPLALEYDVYYKDANVRVDAYYDGRMISSAIYNDTAYITYTSMTMGTNYAEVLDGNWLPIRILDQSYYEMINNDSEVASFNFENQELNHEMVTYMETIMKDGTKTEQWYSLTYKIPLKFHQEWWEGEEKTVIDWAVTNIDESVTLEDDLFDIPTDAEPMDVETDGDGPVSGNTRDLLMYEVKEILHDDVGSEGMMNQVFYYSDSSYEMLVAYFKNLLVGSEDYSVYVQEGRTSIDGTINGELVIVIVNDYMTTEPEVGMNGVNVNYY